MKSTFFIIFLLSIFLLQCDKGLSPSDEVSDITGLSGSIFFQNWPPPDSLVNLRIVAFKTFREKFTAQDIFLQILSTPPEAFIYPPELSDSISLPTYVDSINYKFELPPGRYEYVVIAQQYGPNLLSDWQAVGQYDTDNDSLPSPVIVNEGELRKNILISVDFDNLPIQPF